MSQGKETLLELARAAVALELDGERFYMRAAEATDHPSGKRMFLRLAEEERRHTGEASVLLKDLIGEDQWRLVEQERAGQTAQSPPIVQLEAALAERGRAEVADDTQALRVAMELERRAVAFFEEMEKATDDPVRIETIRRFADEERYHYDLLQAQLDSLINVGLWLDMPEHRMDGKF